MKLVWHIVKKDARRMALPVGLWVAFVVLTTLWLAGLATPAESLKTGLPFLWLNALNSFVGMVVVMQGIIGVVLAGFLMQEDSRGGTTAFWLTRPIAAGRLLAAKTVAAALLLVVAPTVALTPLWLGCGFSVAETIWAALEFMGWQVALTVPAMALGAMTANLGWFLFLAIGVAGGSVALLTKELWHWTSETIHSELDSSKLVVIVAFGLAGALAMLRLQYSHRRHSAWPVLVAAMALMSLVRVAWWWDLRPFFPEPRPLRTADLAPPSENAKRTPMTFDRVVVRPDDVSLVLKAGASDPAVGVLAPTNGAVRVAEVTSLGRTMDYYVPHGRRWGEAAALRLAGFGSAAEIFNWELELSRMPGLVADLRRDPAVLESRLDVAWLRGRVLWEIPLRAGNVGRSGSSRTWVAEVDWDETRRRVLLVERDPLLRVERVDHGVVNQRLYDHTRLDTFLLVHRATGFARGLPLTEVGALRMNAMIFSIRALDFTAPVPLAEREAWEQGATLIKVRFEAAHTFSRQVAAGPVTIVEEKKP